MPQPLAAAFIHYWVRHVGSVIGTGNLSSYSCAQSARAATSTDGCLALDGGTVTCRDGLCVDAWRNGDVSHSLTSPLTDTPGTGSTTLQVTNGDEVIVESAGLELVASS